MEACMKLGILVLVISCVSGCLESGEFHSTSESEIHDVEFAGEGDLDSNIHAKREVGVGDAIGVRDSGFDSMANRRFNIVEAGILVHGYTEVNSQKTWLNVCDLKANNVGVYVEFYVSRPGQSAEYRTLSDSNGSAGGCGDYVAPSGRYIISLNGHSRNGWSTGWKYL